MALNNVKELCLYKRTDKLFSCARGISASQQIVLWTKQCTIKFNMEQTQNKYLSNGLYIRNPHNLHPEKVLKQFFPCFGKCKTWRFLPFQGLSSMVSFSQLSCYNLVKFISLMAISFSYNLPDWYVTSLNDNPFNHLSFFSPIFVLENIALMIKPPTIIVLLKLVTREV